MRYRLGLDLGANSIGWAVLRLDESGSPAGIVRLGSRIFSDGRNPKDKTSLALARRIARQARRRRDRYLRRRGKLLQCLIDLGLMPADEQQRRDLKSLDPYELRARGLDGPLAPFELGRAIYHLNQRRGFLSNRKADRSQVDERGAIKTAIKRTREQMAESGVRTFGEWLWRRKSLGAPVRARRQGMGAKAQYTLYAQRDLIREELATLWEAQSRFHADFLTPDGLARIEDVIFHQRRLRPVQPGRCTFEPHEERAPIAHPLFQRFRILQELNHLRVRSGRLEERSLTLEERRRAQEQLLKKRSVSFDGLRRLLGLPRESTFSLEEAGRKDLKGDQTAASLAKANLFGKDWYDFPLERQVEIVEKLLTVESEAEIIAWLQAGFGFDPARAEAIADAPLPEGYGRLGRTALSKIVPALDAEVVTYDAACQRAGYDHSEFRTGEVMPKLPYYGRVLERHVGFGTGVPDDSDELRFGRIANPSVHIALNQTRKLVNALIERYGHPSQIAIEVARELKQSAAEKKRIDEENRRNREKNERIDQELANLRLPTNGENRLRWRLWEELNPADPLSRRCVYTGASISRSMLFDGSVDIDHILPFSRTLDDSQANKIVCLTVANRNKGDRTPFEAFGHTSDWPAIEERVANLAPAKRRRFAEDGLQEFLRGHDFLARHLNDTRYISRLAREYLEAVCPGGVWVIPGRLTAMLRGKWGLNSILSDSGRKERVDQRHHALDALVVGLTDRAMLQRFAQASARAQQRHTSRLLDEMPEPWPKFVYSVREAVRRVVVSYRPNHSPAGALHNDTAFGIAEGPNEKGLFRAVRRVDITSFDKVADFDAVRDPLLAAALRSATVGKVGKDFKAALQTFTWGNPPRAVRHVRVVEDLQLIPVRDGTDSPYKGYKGDSNYCIEIYRADDIAWNALTVSTFEANQRRFVAHRDKAQNGAPLVMRLCKDDLLAIEERDGRRIMRVVKFSNGRVTLAEHHEGGNLKERDANREDSFKYLSKSARGLQALKARRVFVDVLGYVKDPGNPDDRSNRRDQRRPQASVEA